MRSEVLCTKCYAGNETGSAKCRVCGNDLPVSAEDRDAATAKARAQEIADLNARIAAKKEADARAKAEAEAMAMSETELDDLRKQAEELGV